MKNNRIRFSNGVKTIKKKPIKFIYIVMYIICVTLIRMQYINKIPEFQFGQVSNLFKLLFDLLIITILLTGLYLIVEVIGTPVETRKMNDMLKSIQFVDMNDELPILISVDKYQNKIYYEFYSKTSRNYILE